MKSKKNAISNLFLVFLTLSGLCGCAKSNKGSVQPTDTQFTAALMPKPLNATFVGAQVELKYGVAISVEGCLRFLGKNCGSKDYPDFPSPYVFAIILSSNPISCGTDFTEYREGYVVANLYEAKDIGATSGFIRLIYTSDGYINNGGNSTSDIIGTITNSTIIDYTSDINYTVSTGDSGSDTSIVGSFSVQSCL